MAKQSKFYDLFNLDVPEVERVKNRNMLLNSLSLCFGEAIKELCEKSGLVKKDIPDKVYLSVEMLRKWRKDTDNILNPELESVVKFCYGLYLPPEICEYLWYCLGRVYRKNDIEQAYKEVSQYYHLETLEETNEILKSFKLKIWQDKNY
ncbi:hypothetical protein DW155_07875 [Lactococcus petauri]|uniref:hypothetical protein n=1 Tax=Lactococcus petauri TaxID=1940789 RepID=UPI000E41F5D4|nr:hypothetical protein [Lactococcus petauri]RGB58903.1 hypothetical protein DW155_07875 [Lactococcus petauri]